MASRKTKAAKAATKATRAVIVDDAGKVLWVSDLIPSPAMGRKGLKAHARQALSAVSERYPGARLLPLQRYILHRYVEA